MTIGDYFGFSGESPTLLPFKPLILTSPEKLSTIFFRCNFVGSFFCVRVPDIIRKPNNKKTASRNNMLIKFYIPQWAVDNIRTKTIVKPCQKNPRGIFLCYFQINIKKAARRTSVLQATCGLPKENENSTQLYKYFEPVRPYEYGVISNYSSKVVQLHRRSRIFT